MINVIFLLLLYFMVAGSLEPDFDISLPVSTRNSETNLNVPVVYVAHDGKLWFQARSIDLAELTTTLARELRYEKLRIHADAKANALIISDLMNAASKAGIYRFVLVTRPGVSAP